MTINNKWNYLVPVCLPTWLLKSISIFNHSPRSWKEPSKMVWSLPRLFKFFFTHINNNSAVSPLVQHLAWPYKSIWFHNGIFIIYDSVAVVIPDRYAAEAHISEFFSSFHRLIHMHTFFSTWDCKHMVEFCFCAGDGLCNGHEKQLCMLSWSNFVCFFFCCCFHWPHWRKCQFKLFPSQQKVSFSNGNHCIPCLWIPSHCVFLTHQVFKIK